MIYWNNIPSPYMVERFNAIADRDNIEFEAWFSRRSESDRSWIVDESTWRFPYQYVPALGPPRARLNLPLALCTGRSPDLLVSLYAEPSFILGWSLAQLRGARTAFWVEVTFDSWVRRSMWKERLKKFLFRRVDGVITVGQDGQNFASHYGTPDDRIHLARHVIDSDYFSRMADGERPTREQARSELGLRGTTYVYVGRLWVGKGLDTLLDAFATLQQRVTGEVSLLLVGDGADEDRLRARCKQEGLRNVVFAGFRHKPDLPRYLTAADVFVFPTLGDPYGLVVDEAMACGLPIISTSTAGEIRERVDEGVNGFIVPPANSTALLDRMQQFHRDPSLASRMGEQSAYSIAGWTPERWAEDFETAVAGILGGAQEQAVWR